MYAPNSFLMIGYNQPNTENKININSYVLPEISQAQVTSGYKRTYLEQYQFQYAQVENKYPLFIGNESYDVKIKSIDSTLIKLNGWMNKDNDVNVYDPTNNNAIVIYNSTKSIDNNLISNVKFLSFARWAVHKTEYNSDESKFKTYVYPMVDSLTCRTKTNNDNTTHYGLYWNCNKKVIYSGPGDSFYNRFEGAVNLLRQPIVTGSIGVALNELSVVEYFDASSREIQNSSMFTIENPDKFADAIENPNIDTNPTTTIIGGGSGTGLITPFTPDILGQVTINNQVHNRTGYDNESDNIFSSNETNIDSIDDTNNKLF
jgi:hypothetical protein